jgi:nucleoside 2-deoxyribosyltransferase
MDDKPRIYLAGPDVFLPKADAITDAKRRICAEHGLLGMHPLDNDVDIAGLAPRAAGIRIASANEELMSSCDAIIANLTPWHGPSADAGTVYELGFMRALGRPCFAYSNDPRSFTQRVEEWTLERDHGPVRIDGHGVKRNARGHKIETFQFNDNAMLDGGVRLSGGTFFLGALPEWSDDYHTDLTAFTQAVAAAACALMVTQKEPALA